MPRQEKLSKAKHTQTMATLRNEVTNMSTIREVLFKVELDEFNNEECSIDSYVLFAATSFDRALQWARDKFGPESLAVCVVGYADSDHFGFTGAWCGDIPPCLVWRRVYRLSDAECMAENETEAEMRRANDLAEWQDECAAAASWVD